MFRAQAWHRCRPRVAATPTRHRDVAPWDPRRGADTPMKLVAQTARRTNVLYVAPEGREAKLARGAFDKSHPHLTLEFTNDVNDARRHLKENGGMRRAARRLERRRDRRARAHRARPAAVAADCGHCRRRAGARTLRAGRRRRVRRPRGLVPRAAARRDRRRGREAPGGGRAPLTTPPRPRARCGSPTPATCSSSRDRWARIARSCTSRRCRRRWPRRTPDAAASTSCCSITARATPIPGRRWPK